MVYSSISKTWYSKASVRGEASTYSFDQTEIDDFYFTEAIPHLSNSKIKHRKCESIAHALALCTYLDFTIKLELEIVVPECQRIASGEYGAYLNSIVTNDAMLVLIDEAFHARFCSEMLNSIVSGFNLPSNSYASGNVNKIKNLLNATEQENFYARVLMVIISETLITKSLLSHKNKTQDSLISEMILSHARDEAIHHKYFSFIAEEMFSNLPVREVNKLKEFVPKFIAVFLCPEIKSYKRSLMHMNFSVEEADLILSQSYTESYINDMNTKASVSTIQLLNKCGLI